jgi:hypothetical protein
MRISSFAVVPVLWLLAQPAAAEAVRPSRATIEVGPREIAAPGRVDVTVRLADSEGRPVPVHRNHQDFDVRITIGRTPLRVDLTPSDRGTALEGTLAISRSGVHRIGARVETVSSHILLAAARPVEVVAIAPLDFGVVRAGETVCRPLPEGGRALNGTVDRGALPAGLRLWGECLVADDSISRHEGAFRASINALVTNGLGGPTEPRLYDVTYRLEPRIVTPRRILTGILGLAALLVVATVVVSLRQRREVFEPGTRLLWSPFESSPYRGLRATGWSAVDLTGRTRRRGTVDVGALVPGSGLGAGALRVRPSDDGLVEMVVPRGEEITGVTPSRTVVSARHRLAVPYGSTVTFRGVALSLHVGDEIGEACRSAEELLGAQQG